MTDIARQYRAGLDKQYRKLEKDGATIHINAGIHADMLRREYPGLNVVTPQPPTDLWRAPVQSKNAERLIYIVALLVGLHVLARTLT